MMWFQAKLCKLLYSGYISRAFYFGEFGELTKFAKIKLAKLKLANIIHTYSVNLQRSIENTRQQ